MLLGKQSIHVFRCERQWLQRLICYHFVTFHSLQLSMKCKINLCPGLGGTAKYTMQMPHFIWDLCSTFSLKFKLSVSIKVLPVLSLNLSSFDLSPLSVNAPPWNVIYLVIHYFAVSYYNRVCLKRCLSTEHLISNHTQRPPVTLHTIQASWSIHAGQHLRGDVLWSAYRHLTVHLNWHSHTCACIIYIWLMVALTDQDRRKMKHHAWLKKTQIYLLVYWKPGWWTKISQFNVSSSINKDVVRLDIPCEKANPEQKLIWNQYNLL